MIEVKTSNKERMINISGDINTLLNEVEGVLVKLYGGICSHNNKEVADKCLDELFARVKMSEEERAADTKESKEKVDEISENLAKLLKMDTDKFLDVLMKGLEVAEDELS